MRNIRHEVASDPFQSTNLGNVEETDYSSPTLHRLRRDQKPAIAQGKIPCRKGVRDRFLQKLSEARVFDQIPDVGAGCGLGDSQQGDGSSVGAEDFPILAEGNDSLTDPVDEGL